MEVATSFLSALHKSAVTENQMRPNDPKAGGKWHIVRTKFPVKDADQNRKNIWWKVEMTSVQQKMTRKITTHKPAHIYNELEWNTPKADTNWHTVGLKCSDVSVLFLRKPATKQAIFWIWKGKKCPSTRTATYIEPVLSSIFSKEDSWGGKKKKPPKLVRNLEP